ncbi:hypothetical protein C8K44_14115 [Aminobacter sp. AP02]|nr:hypothetical protein C8K44_14115 [Aminobacter sp. AP02]
MAINLVGEMIDAKRAQAGELVQLVRGIHVGQNADSDATILSHPPALCA